MKRILASMVAVFLGLGILVCGVSADTVFEFRETARYQQDELLAIEWNYDEVPSEVSVAVTSVLLDNVPCMVDTMQVGILYLNIAELAPGSHTLACQYTVNGIPQTKTLEPLVKQGAATVTLSVSVNENGNALVKAVDGNGNPVAGYTLRLSVGDMEGMSAKTDANGQYLSRITASYGETVSCEGVETIIDGVPYAAAAKVEVGFLAPTTTTTQSTTTTTISTSETTSSSAADTTTTAQTTTTETTTTSIATTTTNTTTTSEAEVTTTTTNGTILGAGSTEHKNDRVALNVSLDNQILTAFGVKESVFANKARLLLTKDDYSNLTDRGVYQLMLNVLTSEKVPTTEQIRAAINASSQLSKMEDAACKTVTFDLSFLKLNPVNGKVVPVSALPLNTTYIVELPVPAEMQDAQQLAITFFNGETLAEPIPLEIQGGCFSLEINSLEAYTLIALGADEIGGGNSNSILFIALLIVGILLLVGAALLIFFFVLRKPEPKKTAEAPVFVPDLLDENDIFSGRDDISEINRRPTDNTNK